jgi:hypothetical protein
MAKKKPKPDPKAERRAPIDDAKKEHMLAVLIRNPDAYDAVSELFKVTQCSKGMGEHYGTVWKCVREFRTEYGELPGKSQLISEVHNALKANPSLMGDEEREEIDKFIDFAWDDKVHTKNLGKSKNAMEVAVKTCRSVMEELVANEVHDKVFKEGTLPANLATLLQHTQQQLDLVQSISEVNLDVPFPTGWDKRKDNQMVTTGVPALDALTGGGLMPKECLLFMAPYGSCKTATACDSTAQLVLYAANLYSTGKSRFNSKSEPMIPVVVLVFTESDKDEYRNRLMARLGTVPWRKLREMQSLEDLDDSDKPGAVDSTKYELKHFADALSKDKKKLGWRNEQQRVADAMKAANKHLMLIDCTDSDDNPHKVGTGGMHEVANVIRGIFRKKRKTHYPIMIWVDHLSGLVDRMGDLDEAEQRRELTNMPRIAVEKIGGHFKCPIGLMHQFAGAVQNRGTTQRFHHSDAEGSKSVGKYANFCIVSGKTDENLMCVWEATKHRREPPTAQRIMRVDGDFSTLVDCSKTHGIEPGRNVIMSKEEMTNAGAMKKMGKKGGGLNDMLADV